MLQTITGRLMVVDKRLIQIRNSIHALGISLETVEFAEKNL